MITKRKRERRTKSAPETPTKGQVNSTQPTPPSGGAVQALLHLLQEPYGSGWSFFGKQGMTHARQFQIVITTLRRKYYPCKWDM